MNCCKYILGCLLVAVVFASCNSDKIYPVELQEGMYVIDRHGMVDDYKPDFSGNKFYTYVWINDFNDWLQHTPQGKIDRIIADNPDWEFVTYVKGRTEDSTSIRQKLDKYDCNFPVILDVNDAFCKKNKLQNVCLWGAMCDKKDELLDLSVIGDERSFFDPTFKKVKRMMRGNGR